MGKTVITIPVGTSLRDAEKVVIEATLKAADSVAPSHGASQYLV